MSSNHPGTRYQLSVQEKAGIENLTRLNLNTEVGWPDLENDTFWNLAISGHAPASKNGLPLNIAATDDDHRRISIAEFMGYVEQVRKLPRLKQVNIHPPPRQWLDETQTAVRQSDYGLMIDGFRQIADAAATLGIEIVLENMIVDWARIGDETQAEQADWGDSNVYFGVAPEEWIQICEDVGRANFALCLDTSHACTYAHTIADPGRRAETAMAFVNRPDLIRHVHWNDNYLYDSRGRVDSHALLGKGTMPIELHRAVKGLDATLLIEHFYAIEDLEEELAYIARL
jgi:sugar phosphate isomerase/epimerase